MDPLGIPKTLSTYNKKPTYFLKNHICAHLNILTIQQNQNGGKDGHHTFRKKRNVCFGGSITIGANDRFE